MSRTSKRRRDQRRKHERSAAGQRSRMSALDRGPSSIDDPADDGDPFLPLDQAEAASLDELCATAFRDAEGLAEMDDPIAAEVYASSLMATWMVAELHEADPVALFGRAMVDYLVRRASRDALALLYGLDAIVPSVIDLGCRAGIARLVGQGVEPPSWAELSGTARIEHAWLGTDVYGDQDIVVGRFSYGGEHAHDISMLVDHTIFHIAKDIAVALASDDLRGRWAQAEGIDLGDLDVQAYADRVNDALDNLDAVHEPPVSEDLTRLEPLMAARLAGMPEPRPIDRPVVSEDERDALAERFLQTAAGQALGDGGALVHELIDYAADWLGDPLHWSPITIELCLVDWFPRKWTLPEEDIEQVPDIMRAWARFTIEERGLEEPYASEVLDAVDANEARFREAMHDPGAGGTAKAIVQAMVADGVDPSDEAAVAAWIEEFNARPDAERLRLLGEH